MPQISGKFTGTVTVQCAVGIPDQPSHALVMASVSGRQQSDDANWDGVRTTYSGMGDLLAGEGQQSGYFQNEHANGDVTFGNFEGAETLMGSVARVEGTWNLKRGTGQFHGITGGGKFSAHSTGPISVEMEWSGEYTLPDKTD